MSKYNTDEEIWKDIKGYEGSYQVSNFGRIKSLKRKEFMARNNCYRVRKEKVLKPDIDKQGYEKVRLYKNGKSKNIFVHRLVAIAFIKNTNNYPIINHIDEVPLNNHVSNLEWCTYSYNSTYKGAKERNVKNIRKKYNLPTLKLEKLRYTGQLPMPKERVMGISEEGQYPECAQEKDQFTRGIVGSLFK